MISGSTFYTKFGSRFSSSDINNICNHANNMDLARVVNCSFYNVSEQEGNTTYMPCFGERDTNTTLKLNFTNIHARLVAKFTHLIEVISQKKTKCPTIGHSHVREICRGASRFTFSLLTTTRNTNFFYGYMYKSL